MNFWVIIGPQQWLTRKAHIVSTGKQKRKLSTLRKIFISDIGMMNMQKILIMSLSRKLIIVFQGPMAFRSDASLMIITCQET